MFWIIALRSGEQKKGKGGATPVEPAWLVLKPARLAGLHPTRPRLGFPVLAHETGLVGLGPGHVDLLAPLCQTSLVGLVPDQAGSPALAAGWGG